MKIVEVPICEIKPYENNPRNNALAIEATTNSIKDFGFLSVVVLDTDNTIICGHTRVLAAEKAGMKSVPCIYADQLTTEQVKAYRLADNKTAELAEWDFEKLQAELDGIEMDMGAFGFEELQKEATLDDVEEDNFDEELPEEPKARLGEVWQLGEHRLMCGDSTDPEALKILMDGEKADMVFTDPPYGVAIGSKNEVLNEADKGGCCKENIEGDTLGIAELQEMLTKAMTNLREIVCKSDCSYYVSSPPGGDMGMMMMMMQNAGLKVRHILIWVKNIATFSLGRLDYDYRHEPIFYTWTEKHNFYGGFGTTVIEDSGDIDKLSKNALKDYVKKLLHPNGESVIYENKPSKSDIHPTMKPVRLVARFIFNSSKKGDIVADIFGGSGTTLIACEQLERKCRMMEKDPKYIDAIIQRWETLTGKKAEKIR